jgi:hypothetical protein
LPCAEESPDPQDLPGLARITDYPVQHSRRYPQSARSQERAGARHSFQSRDRGQIDRCR